MNTEITLSLERTLTGNVIGGNIQHVAMCIQRGNFFARNVRQVNFCLDLLSVPIKQLHAEVYSRLVSGQLILHVMSI